MRTLFYAAALAGLGIAMGLGPAPTSAPAQEKQPAAAAKSSPEALRLYADAANFQNNGAFELAAEEWEKFLDRFPDDPLAGKARYYAGVCRLQLKEHEKASAHFEAAVADHPKSELAEDARFNLAAAQYTLAGLEATTSEKREDLYNQSAGAYGELLEQFPEGKYVDRALFWRGEALYRLGKKDEAVEAYAKFVEEHPKSSLRADGLYVLGVTREELGQYPEAGEIYDAFLAEFPEHELAAEVRMRKAETLLQAGQLPQAEKMFAEIAAAPDFPQADHATFRHAVAVAKQNRDLDAANLYATIPNKWPQSAYVEDARLEAARAYYRGGKYETAAPWLQKVIETSPKNAPEAAHWLARIHLRSGEPQKAAVLAARTIPDAQGSEYLAALKMDQAEGLLESGADKAEALELFTAIVEQHPESDQASAALYNAAFTAMSLGRHEEALQLAQSFLQKFPQDSLAPDVKYTAAESHLQLRNHGEAARLFAELAAAETDHRDLPLWRLRWANALYLQKQYQETIDALAPLVKTFEKPEDAAEAQFLIGASRFYLNQPSEAAAALAASVQAAPQGARADEALLLLSRAQRAENQLDQAKATASRLIEQFPQSPLLDQAHYRLGEYHFAAGEYAEAARQYDAVTEKAPQSVYVPYALYGKGWALLQAKDHAKAAEALTALLGTYNDHPLRADALFARAMARRQSGDQQGAIEDADAYLASGGQTHKLEALYERGLAEMSLNQYAEAAKTFETILAEKPDYAAADKALYQLAWANKSAGDNEQAAAHFARLAQEHPESPLAAEAHFHVGEKQYDEKKYAEAAKSYAAAKQRSGRGDLRERATYKLGWASYQQKDYNAALAEFNEQLQSFPKGALASEAQFMKAESLFKLGDYENALPAYQTALADPPADKNIESLLLLHAGQSAAQLKEWDESLKRLETLIEKYPDSPYLAEALYERGFAKQNLEQYDAAMADYEQAAEKSRGAVGARARFMRGEVLFTQKNYDEAVKEFLRVMYGFGGEQAPADVKTWQAKSGYEAARCRDVQITSAATPAAKTKAADEAKRYYAYVIQQHPQSDVAPAAKKRLEELQKL